MCFRSLFLATTVLLLLEHSATSFPAMIPVSFVTPHRPTATTTTVAVPGRRPTHPFSLAAKKNPAKNKGRPSSSGFGGAAAEPCPCGGGVGSSSSTTTTETTTTYMKCCGKLHKQISEFQKATPEQVVRAVRRFCDGWLRPASIFS